MKFLAAVAVVVGIVALGLVLSWDDDPPQEPMLLEVHAFASTSIEVSGEPKELLPKTSIEVSFREAGVISWYAGCNQFGSDVEIATGELTVEDRFNATLRGCPAGGLAAQDEWVVEFLTSDPEWHLDADRLTLTSNGATVELRALPGVVFNAERSGAAAEAEEGAAADLTTITLTDPPSVSCSRRTFPSTRLEAEPDAESGPHPSERLLRAAVTADPDLPDDAWWLSYRTDGAAQFLVDNGPSILEAYLVRNRGRWRLEIARVCDLRAVEPGVEIGTWRLDPNTTPDPESRVLDLIINGLACSSGRGPSGRLLPIAARYGEDSIELTARLDPVPGRFHTCQGTPPVRRTVALDEPVGDRELLNGGVYPASPPADPSILQ